MRIIAYQFEADTYCPACTADRFGPPGGVRHNADEPMLDEHGVPEGATDREGNPVHPVFDLDEWCEPSEPGQQTLTCSVTTCGALLATCEHEPAECNCESCRAAADYQP
jgi:hypothetical protein